MENLNRFLFRATSPLLSPFHTATLLLASSKIPLVIDDIDYIDDLNSDSEPQKDTKPWAKTPFASYDLYHDILSKLPLFDSKQGYFYNTLRLILTRDDLSSLSSDELRQLQRRIDLVSQAYVDNKAPKPIIDMYHDIHKLLNSVD